MTPRRAVRGLLVTPAGELLLLKVREPLTAVEFWVTPGGGLAPGEEPAAAVIREVREETGYAAATTGPVVWERRHAFTWNGITHDQYESYYLFRVPERFDAVMTPAADSTEHETLLEFRWWTAGQIAASTETFAPAGLGGLLGELTPP